jgi:hypothetical protein
MAGKMEQASAVNAEIKRVKTSAEVTSAEKALAAAKPIQGGLSVPHALPTPP